MEIFLSALEGCIALIEICLDMLVECQVLISSWLALREMCCAPLNIFLAVIEVLDISQSKNVWLENA